jgi:four helix bundle protein
VLSVESREFAWGMFNFEKLNVWQRAEEFVGLIYRLTRNFLAEECFGLTDQIRRAANSISSNGAEGSARSPADFTQFIGYASGSLYEIVAQATIARDKSFLNDDGYAPLYREADEISRMPSGLRKSLEQPG